MAQEEATNGSAVAVEKSVVFSAMKPRLMVEASKAADAVQFYKSAFGAIETGRTLSPKRKADQELPHILEAQLELAGTTIVVSDSSSEEADAPAKSVAGAAGMLLCLETEDVEAAIAKAISAGAVKDGEIADGMGKVKDSYGFTWLISTPAIKNHSEEVEA